MRLINEYPRTPNEKYIEDVLVAHGANRDFIRFINTQTVQTFPPNTCPFHVNTRRTLRYSYWRKLDDDVQEILQGFITEHDYEDEDCGTKYSYSIIPTNI